MACRIWVLYFAILVFLICPSFQTCFANDSSVDSRNQHLVTDLNSSPSSTFLNRFVTLLTTLDTYLLIITAVVTAHCFVLICNWSLIFTSYCLHRHTPQSTAVDDQPQPSHHPAQSLPIGFLRADHLRSLFLQNDAAFEPQAIFRNAMSLDPLSSFYRSDHTLLPQKAATLISSLHSSYLTWHDISPLNNNNDNFPSLSILHSHFLSLLPSQGSRDDDHAAFQVQQTATSSNESSLNQPQDRQYNTFDSHSSHPHTNSPSHHHPNYSFQHTDNPYSEASLDSQPLLSLSISSNTPLSSSPLSSMQMNQSPNRRTDSSLQNQQHSVGHWSALSITIWLFTASLSLVLLYFLRGQLLLIFIPLFLFVGLYSFHDIFNRTVRQCATLTLPQYYQPPLTTNVCFSGLFRFYAMIRHATIYATVRYSRALLTSFVVFGWELPYYSKPHTIACCLNPESSPTTVENVIFGQVTYVCRIIPISFVSLFTLPKSLLESDPTIQAIPTSDVPQPSLTTTADISQNQSTTDTIIQDDTASHTPSQIPLVSPPTNNCGTFPLTVWSFSSIIGWTCGFIVVFTWMTILCGSIIYYWRFSTSVIDISISAEKSSYFHSLHTSFIASVHALWMLHPYLFMFLQNIIACLTILSLGSSLPFPHTFRLAAGLLCALLVYDVFWVFISPIFFHSSVMVQVATGGAAGSNNASVLDPSAIASSVYHQTHNTTQALLSSSLAMTQNLLASDSTLTNTLNNHSNHTSSSYFNATLTMPFQSAINIFSISIAPNNQPLTFQSFMDIIANQLPIPALFSFPRVSLVRGLVAALVLLFNLITPGIGISIHHLLPEHPKSSLLGLGDVVFPAIFLAWAYAHDFSPRDSSRRMALDPYLGPKIRSPLDHVASWVVFPLFAPFVSLFYSIFPCRNDDALIDEPSFHIPLYSALLWAYGFALLLTETMARVFATGQPALLYISPCLVGTTCFIAYRRGSFAAMWNE